MDIVAGLSPGGVERKPRQEPLVTDNSLGSSAQMRSRFTVRAGLAIGNCLTSALAKLLLEPCAYSYTGKDALCLSPGPWRSMHHARQTQSNL